MEKISVSVYCKYKFRIAARSGNAVNWRKMCVSILSSQICMTKESIPTATEIELGPRVLRKP